MRYIVRLCVVPAIGLLAWTSAASDIAGAV